MNGFVHNRRSQAVLIMLGTTALGWGGAFIHWGIGKLHSPNQVAQKASVSFGACTLILPSHLSAPREEGFRMPNSQAQSCPPLLLHSLLIKARLQCANQKSLIRVPGVGSSAADRILRATNTTSWEGLRSKARLNTEQLKALKRRFVFDGAFSACPS